MQELGVFITLAEIAGVFVGFGALIAVRSSDASAREVAYIGSVVVSGVWVVAVALVPVTIGAYDIGDRELWFVSGLVALAGVALYLASMRSLPRFSEAMADLSRERRIREQASNIVLFFPMLGALILVVLGLFPQHDAALYLTAVVLGLLLTAMVLLELVFEHRGPQAEATDEAEQRPE
jgi:hypothetical protein